MEGGLVAVLALILLVSFTFMNKEPVNSQTKEQKVGALMLKLQKLLKEDK